MMPLDDELRALLSSRADAVAPAPDPLAGIEARAGRLRRRRTARAVVGSALAVALVGVGVPAAVQGAGGTSDGGSPLAATAPPTAGTTEAPPTLTPPRVPAPSAPAPSPAPVTSPAPDAALDPEQPWDYRGARLPAGFLAEVREQWTQLHPGTTVTPLFGQVYEPSGRPEVVLLSTGPTATRWAVLQASDSGPQVVADEELREGGTALVAALAGDEQARLLVVAAPRTRSVLYDPDRDPDRPVRSMTAVAPGVAVTPLDGDEDADRVRVVGADGRTVYDRAAPSLPARPSDEGPGSGEDEVPGNVVDWPVRGDVGAGPAEDGAAQALAEAQQVAPGQVRLRVLFAGSTDGGLRFLLGQTWLAGEGTARTFGWSTGGEGGPDLFLGAATPAGAQVLAYVPCCSPGTSTDTLVVVPVPGTGQVLYGDDDATEFRAVGAGQDGLDGVVLVDRDPRATTDQLRLLDGDGRTTWTGAVAPLLCARPDCG